MRCDFFTISVSGDRSVNDELNQLLATARVLSVDRQFVADGANSFWSICVVSQPVGVRPEPRGRKPAIDYREVLSPDDFAVYARLREVRKTISTAEGIPPYSVFTNEQIAEIVTRKVSSLTALREIPGIGEARVEKYGTKFLSMLAPAEKPPGLPVT